MKLQQLRYACQVVKNGLNLSEAAEALHTSQPGISKQIRLLEDELGVQIFIRHGKRVVGLTEPGRAIVVIAERILREAENLQRAGQEFQSEISGSLVIATTHTQARYVLPSVIQRFMAKYPGVRLALHQGSPAQIAQQVVSGEADIAIATEAIAEFEQLVMLPCYQWNRCVVALPGHPLLKVKPLTLEELAKYPLITYDFAFTGRGAINRAFEQKGLTPTVVLTAIDADIIKTYAALGLGVGILARMAYDPKQDSPLEMVDAAHLFEASTTRIGIRRDAYLRGYAYDFIEMFAPHLSRSTVDSALRGGGSHYEL